LIYVNTGVAGAHTFPLNEDAQGGGSVHHHYLTIQQRETLEKLVRSRMSAGARIESALARLDQPDYGVCIECGKDIEYVLLEADPSALHCRACGRLPVPPPP